MMKASTLELFAPRIVPPSSDPGKPIHSNFYGRSAALVANVHDALYIVDGAHHRLQRTRQAGDRQQEVDARDLGTRHVASWAVLAGDVAAAACSVPLDSTLRKEPPYAGFAPQRRVEVLVFAPGRE